MTIFVYNGIFYRMKPCYKIESKHFSKSSYAQAEFHIIHILQCFSVVEWERVDVVSIYCVYSSRARRQLVHCLSELQNLQCSMCSKPFLLVENFFCQSTFFCISYFCLMNTVIKMFLWRINSTKNLSSLSFAHLKWKMIQSLYVIFKSHKDGICHIVSSFPNFFIINWWTG